MSFVPKVNLFVFDTSGQMKLTAHSLPEVDAVSDGTVWPPFSGFDGPLPSPLLDMSPSPSAET